MKALSVLYGGLCKEKSMRCDVSYQKYRAGSTSLVNEYYLFSDIFDICPPNSAEIDSIDGDFEYCQIGDVDKFGNPNPVCLNFSNRDLQSEDYYKKIEKGDIISVQKNDILMSFLIPADFSSVGKFVRIDDSKSRIYFTSAFLQLRPKVSPVVMYYCLKSVFYDDIANISRVRKGYTGYATISPEDLRNAHLDKSTVDKLIDEANSLTAQIVEIEDQLHKLESTLLMPQAMIDEVFACEFGFNYERFEALKTQTSFQTSFSSLANNPDMRFSAKFHRDAGAFVMQQLTGVTDKRIKHFLAEPIVLGASVSPDHYSDVGDYYYISMATIKSWAFDPIGANLVSDSYSADKQAKTIKKDDIILARSGEGTIGKVARIDDENLHGVFADFTMRIRLTNYNSHFAYYYFRTTYFQYLVEIYKKGLGNNTNIFPVIIQEFPIPDISLGEQERIVDQILTEISKQDSIRAQIAGLRSKINSVIELAITKSS